ncbi:ribulose-5-phosphate 4-epimerase/fuculose-1-phosphate aldolase [Yoonia maricola]|uniref:3-oxo-tetronate 4-phosphate decarboxylase n=1 Tax=Yoonia maricola TaxID=420999 RepID=A0A2M8W4C7_9RHOB|nr:aldolase [Yoonia maricola]PJI85776.1 ribulose-5-phosphate 4-epimerase/fuculose-1-phosphate aldolase [Yoonia maricola]
MTEITKLREDICVLAKSMFDRGLTCGSSGNISARLSDGTVLVTPTGRAMGFLDPAQISHLDQDFNLLSGDPPTKETPLHAAFYETRSRTGAVVHLHSTHAVALSMLPETDPDNVLPPLTPYTIMRLGKVQLLPFFLPGDPGMRDAVRGLAGKRSAVLLANHGPVVAGKDIWAAAFAMEELEEAAKLAILTRGMDPARLTAAHIQAIVKKFDVDW